MKGSPIKIDACARDAGKTLGAGLAPLKRGPFGQAKRAPLITRNSEFPRSELRETLSSGRPYNWRYARADNWLEATLRIEAVPSTRRMIIGQIHSDGSNSGQAAPLVKLLYQLRLDQGRVQALVRERPDDGGTRAYTLMDGIPLGQSFSYRIGVSRSGLLSVSVNGSALEQQLDPQWAYQGLYFKAGLYLQDNRGPSSEGGRATFSELRVSHQ